MTNISNYQYNHYNNKMKIVINTFYKVCYLLWQPEAICTGTLAGYNAVRQGLGMPSLILPRSIAVGDIIGYANDKVASREGRKTRYTFAGSEYFKRMKDKNLYTIDIEEINKRINQLNLDNIFNISLM
ncbi:hypothetical protein SAMN02745163_02858 [Clostridium cavendishii DSM 21758]|uniref:Uncharacterized protein n=1 Tax=Clostridium cavendishii DSM 21758 TaxID=1121302 RepID=A0A1M6NBT2_9CLOT|nr:hypothetical protein SAMN02745163_02858 [Clostridium cavendishii DSM 21758]